MKKKEKKKSEILGLCDVPFAVMDLRMGEGP